MNSYTFAALPKFILFFKFTNNKQRLIGFKKYNYFKMKFKMV